MIIFCSSLWRAFVARDPHTGTLAPPTKGSLGRMDFNFVMVLKLAISCGGV